MEATAEEQEQDMDHHQVHPRVTVVADLEDSLRDLLKDLPLALTLSE